MSLPSHWSRVLVLAWTLPLFLLGPVLHGRALLWHAHDDVGAHLHILTEHAHAAHGEGAHAPWLVHEHQLHAHGHHEGQAPAPHEHQESDCFVVPFSGPILAGTTVAAALAERVLSALGEPRPPGRRSGAVGELRPASRGQRAKLRSGAAALVATGRALRI
jgi:hypothetical protein